jgi:hypothetical protein
MLEQFPPSNRRIFNAIPDDCPPELLVRIDKFVRMFSIPCKCNPGQIFSLVAIDEFEGLRGCGSHILLPWRT